MEVEKRVLEKVGEVISSIEIATNVDEIILALYSLASSIFPINPQTTLGTIDKLYRHQLSNLVVTSPEERTEWIDVFYKGSAFLAFSRLLLYDVACNWLAFFPTCATKCVYDVFFLNNDNACEIVQVLVPCLHLSVAGSYDVNTVTSNAERLIVLGLLENDMVLEMAREFRVDNISHEQHKQNITRMAQLITSIPDKARRGAPISLSPSFFFKRITTYLLRIEEECDFELVGKAGVANETHLSGPVLFVGEIFARICRRGSTDVLLSEVIRRILEHVRGVLSSSSDLPLGHMFESKSFFRFWSSIIEAVNDSHSVERIAEELLNQLADKNVSDLEAYWTLWILFGQICECRTSVRFIFVEKFLLWKVFPLCCVRWILHFAVLECSPDNISEKYSYSTSSLSETVHRLVIVWSNKEFVQSSPTERQTYLTAALGLCLQMMTKEDLGVMKGVLPSILQGISSRLESPVYLIRKMASCIALVFSKVIDPEHPLYLDDSCEEDSIDWKFGLANPRSRGGTRPLCLDHKTDEMESSTVLDETRKRSNGVGKTLKSEVAIRLLDPDEVIDPATVDELTFGGYDSDVESEDSGISIDSLLEPYDLADDDTDLKRKFSQLVDVVGALRKSDDAEGVESALDVAETLIRALPDELKYIASELAKILVQVRCSESTIEGEEDSAEDKRQKSLVALVVACPVETLDSLNKLIYSANLDISQRIMILDVMTESAQELACPKIIKKLEKYQKPLITSTSDQPWFVPRSTDPSGAGSWKEIYSSGSPLNWSYSYERELPSRERMGRKGETRRWSNRVKGNEMEWSQNNFPNYVAAFMLPFMREFDKKRHGVDLLGRDFIVLGKLIYMLGVCMKCAAMHPEASLLASPLLDMLRSREICHHKEAYVRRSVLFAASCVLMALHPSYVASAVVEGNVEVSQGLDWVRAWALQVAESDTDRECHSLAMACLQLHAEMALQASRAMESTNDRPFSATNTISLFPSVSNKSGIPVTITSSLVNTV